MMSLTFPKMLELVEMPKLKKELNPNVKPSVRHLGVYKQNLGEWSLHIFFNIDMLIL